MSIPCFNRHGIHILSWLLLIGLLSLPFGQEIQAQSTDLTSPTTEGIANDTPSSNALEARFIEQRLQALEANSSLTDEEKSALRERYQGTLDRLTQLQDFQQRTQRFRDAISQSPLRAAEIREALERRATTETEPVAPEPIAEDLDLKAIERLLAQQQAEIASLDAQLAEARKRIEELDQAPTTLRNRITQTRTELGRIDAELGEVTTFAAGPAPDDLAQASRWLLEAQRLALNAEQAMLDQQLLSLDARRELADAQLEQLSLDRQALQNRRARLQARADQLRRELAAEVSAETAAVERRTADAHPLIRHLAEDNGSLSQTISSMTEQLAAFRERQLALESDLERIDRDFRSARQRLEAAGLNQALGQALIDRRAQLPRAEELRRDADALATRLGEAALRQIRHEDELQSLYQLEAHVETLLGSLTTEERLQIADSVTDLAERRKALLERASDLGETHQKALADLEFTSQQLIIALKAYDDFLAERLLWVRSIPPITEQSLPQLLNAIRWLLDPTHWLESAAALGEAALRSVLLWLGLSLSALLLWRRRTIRRRIQELAKPLHRASRDRLVFSLEALGLTLISALPWPLALFTLGWQLQDGAIAGGFQAALGSALMQVAPALFYLTAFRALCLPDGVADRHFRWPGDQLQLLRRSFALTSVFLLPIGFVAAIMANQANPDFHATLGRLALSLLEIGLALLIAVLLHPSRGVLQALLARRPQGWAHRLRRIWYPLVVGIPLALAGITLAGYLYTSATLLGSLISQLWLVLGLVVLHQLIVRWLVLTRRSLTLQAALARRANLAAQRQSEQAEIPQTEETPITGEEESIDLASLDSQTRRLINTLILIGGAVGSWWIWADVLPALNLFEKVTLWTYSGSIDGVKQQIPVTLASLGQVLLILLLSVVAGKNLPALLEILLLKNSQISASGRYTLSTLTGYLIIAFAAIFVFSALGLSWGQMQWLVAALGVGIGFGLQEIVANFISGLIILFERPIRVGDIVTIGDTTGTVTKIRIRATTIRNYDRQELLVPNKEFITGRLLNWTLSDQVNRITLQVGVDYGGDTRKALQILAEVAAENPNVLEDPAPIISFEGFGDNALNLVLRCYLESLDHRLATITELHQSIDDRYREAGIGIAFPQRDVHLYTSEPLAVQLSRERRVPL